MQGGGGGGHSYALRGSGHETRVGGYTCTHMGRANVYIALGQMALGEVHTDS